MTKKEINNLVVKCLKSNLNDFKNSEKLRLLILEQIEHTVLVNKFLNDPDLNQDIVIKIFKKLPTHYDSKSNLLGWVYTVTKNYYIDKQIRKDSKYEFYDVDDMKYKIEDKCINRTYSNNSVYSDICSNIEDYLTHEEYEVVQYKIKGYKTEEISKILNKKINKIRNINSSIKKKIKNKIF